MFSLRQQLKIQYRRVVDLLGGLGADGQGDAERAGDGAPGLGLEETFRLVQCVPPTLPARQPSSCAVFHEVRVPLNTALLAVQNLEGENVFKGLDKDQGEMVHGLMGSLTMMEKVGSRQIRRRRPLTAGAQRRALVQPHGVGQVRPGAQTVRVS